MDHTDQIREKVDIVSYVSEFVTLKRAGRNFAANCPFHSEKTPSFIVSPERQTWHCFGCHKGGDVFSFLMEYEHIDFPEALRLLAKRAGVTLTGRGFDSQTSSKKDAIYTINRQAAEFYHYLLTKHRVGSKALAYLKDRGVSEKVIKSFMLGMAPNVRNGLVRYLTGKKGHKTEDLLDAGLVSTIGRDTVDFFRGRVIFPLFDHHDNILGFAGRTLDTTGVVKAKYINTRDTVAYHKGEMFYGLHLTKDAIRKADQAILVEGEFDVISCFQSGVGNVVGIKGTALTEKQAQLLARYAKKVTVCFDGDRAGKEAIKRSLPILEKYHLQTSVIVIPGGKDPDEAIKTNPVTFKQAVKNDIGIYDYLLTEALQNNDVQTATGKGKIATELLPILGGIGNEIIKEHYLKKLSTELDTTYESLQRELGKIGKRMPDEAAAETVQTKLSREDMLSEYLLALIVQYESSKAACLLVSSHLGEQFVATRSAEKVLVRLSAYLREGKTTDIHAFAKFLPPELLPSFDKAVLMPLPEFSNASEHLAELEKTTEQLKKVALKKRIQLLSDELKIKEKEGAEEETAVLQKQVQELVSLLEK
jgi:DNA primase